MDDLRYGKRNKRGDWVPNDALATNPLLLMPPRPSEFLSFLKGFFVPWNLLFAASAVLYAEVVLPDVAVMRTFGWAWIAKIFAANCIGILLFYSAFEYRLYRARAQGSRFKYNAKFPNDLKNSAFMFGSQNAEGLIRTFGTAIPIWTAYEVVVLWTFANSFVPWLSFAQHPLYLGLLALLVPVIHETHFFMVHRLIHWGPLYRWIHSVHHNSVNPSPWSSLSMHPVEHLLYFSTILVHVIIPSNPILALYQINFAGFGAIVGHIGFDKIETGEQAGFDSHAYSHYLHHKYFEVNYGDGVMPLDKWFGTWHDGSAAGDKAMNARFEKRNARLNAGRSPAA